MKTAASTWRERVSSWETSGQSQQKYCADKTYSHQSLQRWSRRLREHPAGPVAFVRVVRSARGQSASASSPALSPPVPTAVPVVVEVGCARLLVSSAADVSLVALLVRALQEAS